MHRLPHHLWSRKSLALALAAAIVVLATGGTVTLFLLGWPPFPSSTPAGKAGTATIVVEPSKSARLTSPAGDVLLEFPAGSVERQTTVSYRRVSPSTIAGLPPDFILTNNVFDLSVVDTEAWGDTEFRFLQPVTVTILLSDDHATASEGSYSNVAIQHFDTDSGKWTPLQTTIDLAARTAQVKIQSLDSLALTVRRPVSPPERVFTHGSMSPQGYLGRGVLSLTVPRELGETNTARVSLKITLGDPYPADRSTPGPTEGRTTIEGQPPMVGDSPGVVIDASVPVHQLMSFKLDAPGFEMAPPGAVPRQVRDGQAGWSWIIAPTEGPLGEREVSALVTANGETLSTLKTSVMVTRSEPATQVTPNAGTYPHPITTPAPVPTATPVVNLATEVVPQASPTPAPVVTPTVAPLPTPAASLVPVPSPTAVPSISPTTNEILATAIPTPIVKPSPSPRFRLFVNGVQAPALNDMMSVGGNTVILSKAAEVGGAFQFNDKVTIAVSLGPGYRVEWRGVDAVRGPFATVYMNQDRFVAMDIVPPSANPTPIPTPVPFYQQQPRVRERPSVVPTPIPRRVRTYSLTVESVPEEGGSVSPEGITRHPAGVRVSLTPAAADGYAFSHWSEPCPASLDCIVTMNSDRKITAHFTRIFKLNTFSSPPGGGTVVPEGTTLHRATAEVTVVANPGDGYQFSHWTGDCSGSGACTVIMDSSKSVTAKFLPIFDLTATADPYDGGVVTPEGITSYVEGTNVTVLAYPADGYRFSKWNGACAGDGPCSVTINEDTTVTAKFERGVDLTVAVNPPDGGTVLPIGTTSHKPGAGVAIVASAAKGYQFSEWTGDCTGNNACVVNMDVDKSVTANFVRVFTLTSYINLPGGGTTFPNSVTSHTAGSHVSVIASPTHGYQFMDWSGDCIGRNACVVVMDADKSVRANFAPVFGLTVAADPADGGTVLPGDVTSYVDGTKVTVLAYPAARYHFSKWSGDCSGNDSCLVTITEDKAVTANFIRGIDLTVSAMPPEGGKVLPPGETSHMPGDAVTVVASPADGYQFSEWTGDCTGSGNCVVTMDTDKAVTAEFVRVFNLTTEANPVGGGVTSPGTNTVHASGAELTIIANPAEGYQFSEWGGDCTGRNPCIVTMDTDKSVTANFVPVFTFTAATDPADGGTVLPGGVTSYVDGTKVTVLAYPAAGYRFSGWNGDCSGSDSCLVTINEDKAVTAKFTRGVDLTVTVNPPDGGTILPPGETSHYPGAAVTVVATPAEGYQFSEWVGDCTGSGACVVAMDADKTVTANFVGVFDLTVTAAPTSGGSVFPGSTTSYAAGDQVTVLARSAVGYQFSEWNGDCSGDSACVVTMDSDKSVTAKFKPVFDLTVSADPPIGGIVLPGGATSYISGAHVTVLAHSSLGYQFSSWSGDCSGSSACVVTMDANKSVTANFAKVFDLTVASSPANGGIAFPSETTSYVENHQVTVTARPGYGYGFSGWDGECSGYGQCVVTMDADKTVTANFVRQFFLTAAASPAEGGTVSPAGTTQHAEGAEVTVTASPAEGYGFSRWSGDCSGAGPCVVTMDGDKTVTAIFVTRFTLTTMAEPSSGGTVSPEGTTSYDAGTQVTVSATPATGYNFSGWSGDCSGSGSCVVTMDGDKSVTARFTSTAAIVFHSSRDGNSEIYVMDTDGSNITRLTNNTTADLDPNWAHDGNKIAFVAARDGNSEIYVMNVDGSSPVNLTNNDAEDISPAWSPDGTRIAFVSTRGEQQDIYVMDADGSNQTKLTDDDHLDDSPDWSPDGAKIVFTSQRNDDYEIYTILADGSGVTRLTNSEGHDLSPVWSLDGETIAFTSFRDENAEIYTMWDDGTEQWSITFNTVDDESPAWSPDSTKIILVSDQTDIVMYDAEDPEGVEPVTITTGGSGDGGLDWKPNSTWKTDPNQATMDYSAP